MTATLGLHPQSPLGDADIRRILLEHQLIFTEAQTCIRWGLGVSTLRKWKRERRPWRVNAGVREWVIIALWEAGESGVAAAELIGWIDYHDHAVYSEVEIAGWLDGLVGDGTARFESGRWVFARDLGSFVF